MITGLPVGIDLLRESQEPNHSPETDKAFTCLHSNGMVNSDRIQDPLQPFGRCRPVSRLTLALQDLLRDLIDACPNPLQDFGGPVHDRL
jgi:hypothetical protein